MNSPDHARTRPISLSSIAICNISLSTLCAVQSDLTAYKVKRMLRSARLKFFYAVAGVCVYLMKNNIVRNNHASSRLVNRCLLGLGHFLSAPVPAITTGFPCQKLTAVQSKITAGPQHTRSSMSACRHSASGASEAARPFSPFPCGSLWRIQRSAGPRQQPRREILRKATAELESVAALVMATATPARYCVRWPGRATGFICS